MATLIALTLFLIFLALSALHVFWMLGGKWGAAAALPTNGTDGRLFFSPGPFSTIAVAGGLLAMGLFMPIKASLWQIALPGWLGQYGLWAIAFIFLLRAMGDFRYVGFFKKVKNTTFGWLDTQFYSPLCVLIGLLALWLEWLV